jgi:hypothetical protein
MIIVKLRARYISEGEKHTKKTNSAAAIKPMIQPQQRQINQSIQESPRHQTWKHCRKRRSRHYIRPTYLIRKICHNKFHLCGILEVLYTETATHKSIIVSKPLLKVQKGSHHESDAKTHKTTSSWRIEEFDISCPPSCSTTQYLQKLQLCCNLLKQEYFVTTS